MTPIGRSYSTSSARMRASDLAVVFLGAMTEVEPEDIDAGQHRRRSISADELAGPTVATILVCRWRRKIGALFRF